MKRLVNVNASDLRHAATTAAAARQDGRSSSYAGGGSDLLALIKDGIVAPDVLVNLKTIKGLDQIAVSGGALAIGASTTLDAVGRHPMIRRQHAVLAEAAASVATPQIRNVGTLGGNLCQRPWCWYFRNGFPCLKNGGTTCFSAVGENQFHAIFGGGPSYIVHPSDTAPALVALEASVRIVGPSGERTVPAAEFFVLPREDARRENVLRDDEIVASVSVPAGRLSRRSTYHKILDREAWTHAVVSAAVVLDLEVDTCRAARIVLGGVAPIPWRVPAAEQVLVGHRITADLAAKAGELAVEGARPLAKNGYKVALTRAVVRRTIVELASRG